MSQWHKKAKMLHKSTKFDQQISENPDFVLKNFFYQNIDHFLFKIIHE